MTTNLHDKMLAAIDAYFSASDGTEAEVAENLLLDVRDEINKQQSKAQPDYAWPTIEDYEEEVGFEVNIAFRSAWAMARTTNDLFKQMGETK